MPPTTAPVRRALVRLALAGLAAVMVVGSAPPPRVVPGASWPVSAQTSAPPVTVTARGEPSVLSDMRQVADVIRFVNRMRWSEATVNVAATKSTSPTPTTTRAPSSGSVWDDLAECESSGDWSANTGNGFEGGLQFSHSTWVAYGGLEFASHAHLATREQQIIVAERVRAGQGWGAWPSCSRKLALR